ncbi:response regulator transcription factor [Sulfurovum sp. XTW-4]|uniref:Response regulator transcription factor n=1 Tax=Sulfurovum xiamenensis TaxID=3019066 RepID=A0ABT7QQ45_9BACT|nr:response regulator transcription factor [Sulfurovum xiamenensis]MDM5263156.1 response regulator transcription factor [Sulfurovum xiamenensis]
MRILLLEDDQILCDSLKEFLELEGYTIDVAHRGPEVFDLTFNHAYDLYILDVNVPEVDGFDVLSELKDAGDETPAIYITALTDINSISRGFALGAEDYIKKPFDPEELLIRIKRKYQKEEELICLKDITYNPVTRVLQKSGQTIGLGDVQQNLFHALITSQNKIVESYLLMDFLEQPSANALRVNLAKLKNKLGIEIKNIRGKGYMIEKI